MTQGNIRCPKAKNLASSERGLSAKLTGGVSYIQGDTPSTASRFPSPYGGGKH